MRTARWLAAAGLLASATGCIEINGLPNTSMGGYPGPNYGGYYGQPAYSSLGGGLLNSLFSPPAYYPPPYQPAPQYIAVPVAQPQIVPSHRHRWANRDRNNNGIPDWQERRANGGG